MCFIVVSKHVFAPILICSQEFSVFFAISAIFGYFIVNLAAQKFGGIIFVTEKWPNFAENLLNLWLTLFFSYDLENLILIVFGTFSSTSQGEGPLLLRKRTFFFYKDFPIESLYLLK